MTYDSDPTETDSVDISGVSDATVLLMLADLAEAGHMKAGSPLPLDPAERSHLRMQIMQMFWQHFGKDVWRRCAEPAGSSTLAQPAARNIGE